MNENNQNENQPTQTPSQQEAQVPTSQPMVAEKPHSAIRIMADVLLVLGMGLVLFLVSIRYLDAAIVSLGLPFNVYAFLLIAGTLVIFVIPVFVLNFFRRGKGHTGKGIRWDVIVVVLLSVILILLFFLWVVSGLHKTL